MLQRKMSRSKNSCQERRELLRPKAICSYVLCAAAALLLAACSTTKNQAPIESRAPSSGVQASKPTPAGGASPIPSTTAPVAGQVKPGSSTPQPTSGTSPDKPVGVAETGTVKQGATESRPLGPAAPGSSGTASTSPVSPSPALPTVLATPLKGGAKAAKRPYTDASLAELRASDAASMPVVVAGSGTTPVATNPVAAGGDSKPGPSLANDSKAGEAKPNDANKSSVPASFAWPSKGKVLAGFNEPKQMGLAIDGRIGDPIAAAGDGKVIFSGVGPRGYGNLIIVKHEGELLSVYAHNKTLLVKENQEVKKGQKIAELGDSGTDKPQLHFEIRKQGKPVDPKQYLPGR